jgi:hypothetical protein
MMHDLRIVNARGRQEWNGHDHYDEAHPTLPHWRDSRPSYSITRTRANSRFHQIMLGCYSVSTGVRASAVSMAEARKKQLARGG